MTLPADWPRFGSAGGPIRNWQMLRDGRPDVVLAFHDDIAASKGTKNMLGMAQGEGIPTRLYTGRE